MYVCVYVSNVVLSFQNDTFSYINLDLIKMKKPRFIPTFWNIQVTIKLSFQGPEHVEPMPNFPIYLINPLSLYTWLPFQSFLFL